MSIRYDQQLFPHHHYFNVLAIAIVTMVVTIVEAHLISFLQHEHQHLHMEKKEEWKRRSE